MKTLKESILNRSSHSGESFKAQRRDMIETWLKKYNIENYTINKDFTIDVDGGVYLAYSHLHEFPEYIQFNIVKGNFDCRRSDLKSLKGAPKEVGGFFDCEKNNLTSLEGAPEKTEGSFGCVQNELTSLKGAPKEVGGRFGCDHNKLTSLEGAPEKVKEYFDCSFNKLTSLEGAPKEVGGFDCSFNKLTSLRGVPKEVGGDFYCSNNKVQFTEEDVRKVCNVKGEIFV